MNNPTMDWICLDDEAQSSQKISQSQPEYDFTPWPRHEQQAFERAVSELDLDSPNFFRDLSSKIHWRTMHEVKVNFAAMIDDILKIEAGHYDVVESESGSSDSVVDDQQMNDQGGGVLNENRGKCSNGRTGENAAEVANIGGTPAAGGTAEGGPSTRARKKRAVPVQRRRGVPWTKEQHRLFLMGMKKVGRGDWRTISRNFVLTKTPTQVASHAQKYFRRLESTTPVERRRPSIHDIHTISSTDISTPPLFGTMYNFYQQNPGTLQSTVVTQPMIIPQPPSTMYNYQHSAGTSTNQFLRSSIYDIPSTSRTAFSMAPLAQSLPIPPPPTTMYNYQTPMVDLQSRLPNDVSRTPTSLPPPPTSMNNHQNLNVNTINLGNNHAFDQPSTSSVSPMSFNTMMMNQPSTSNRSSYMFSFPEKQPWF